MSRDYRQGALAGALALAVVGAIGLGGGAVYLPEHPLLGLPGRIFDSLAFHMLGLGLGLCALLALAGARRLAAAFALAAIVAGSVMGISQYRHGLPLTSAGPHDLTVLWFNVLFENTTPPEQIAAALLGSGADVLVLSEAEPLRSVLGQLQTRYPFRLGCERRCSMLVLSRLPPGHTEMRSLGQPNPDRLAEIRIAPEGHMPLRLMALHFIKPWHYGQTEHDLWYLKDQIDRGPGTLPLVLVGDFNSAPWSRRLDTIRADHGLSSLRRTPATWPAFAGPFGVPIDQLLVRGDVAVSSITPWGDGLGSNHRGLLFSLVLPPT
jgi:endonuclease/exonuclease/phosphatase (EEP) superfamily protein YafD